MLKDEFQSSEEDNCKNTHASYIYTVHTYHLCLKKGIRTAKDLQINPTSEKLYGLHKGDQFFTEMP